MQNTCIWDGVKPSINNHNHSLVIDTDIQDIQNHTENTINHYVFTHILMITTPKIIKKNKKDLLPAPYNPRIDVKKDSTFYQKLYASIVNFGYVEPIIWNKQTGFVCGGNQRLAVLMDIDEIEMIDVVEVDLPLEKEKALNLALNKISGDWDYDLLAEVLADLQKEDDIIDFTGFDEKEINEIINNFNLKEPGEEDYDVDEALQKPPKYSVKLGEVYQLGGTVVCPNCGEKHNL